MDSIKRWIIFERRFPSEEERYDQYIWLLKISLAAIIFHALTILIHAETLSDIMRYISGFTGLWISIVAWQEAWKSRAVHFILRLILCSCISAFFTAIASMVWGPVAFILGALVTIFANRKHLRILGQYRSFLLYTLVWLLITTMIPVYYHFVGATIYFIDDFYINMSAIIKIVYHVILFCFLYRLLRYEYQQGRPLKECIRILMVIPMIGLFLLLGWLSIIPVGFTSHKRLFGDADHDYLACPNKC